MSLHFLVRSNPLQRVNRLKPVTTSGFTLMEMLIVIAIMLLLVIATLPRIKYALDESKVRESTRQLNSYFSMAKSRAASTGRPCGVFFQSELIGPATPPGTFHSTQLYLAEVPPPYSGDLLEAKAWVINDPAYGGNAQPLIPQIANGSIRWQVNFVPGSAGSLATLVTATPREPLLIRFDHKGRIFPGYLDTDGYVYVTGPVPPPAANGVYHSMNNPYAGYQYEIARSPRRIGAPLSLPRGTSVDLTYSGAGNSGVNFYSSQDYVLVMFTPNGRVGSVTYQTWDSTNSVYVAVSNAGEGTLHFLVGRPEKVGLPLNQSNLWDNNALWVSVGRLTGSVTSTDNAPNINLPYATAPQQQVFLTTAREYAITQDVRGGQ